MAIAETVAGVRNTLRMKGVRIAAKIEPTTSLTCFYDNETGTVGVPSWQVIRSTAALHRTLVHECGHAFLYENNCAATPGFENLFGRLTSPYPKDHRLLWAAITPRQPAHVSSYAKAHPEEDFAETFTHVILGTRLRNVSPKLKKKIQFVHDAIAQHQAAA